MATETLRPNAAGDETEWSYCTGGAHWEAVDEETPDELTTKIYTWTPPQRDLFNIPNHSEGSGTINKVTVFWRCKSNTTDGNYDKASIKTHGIVYDGDAKHLTSDWQNFSQEWTVNPYTSSAWTWDEIDALQIGVKADSGQNWHYCTQVWVEVDYTTDGVTPKTSSDTGSGADAKSSGNPVATLTRSEGGSGLDTIFGLLGKLTSDAGSGVDAYVSLEKPGAKTSSDTGFGIEGTPLPSAFLAGSETGSGIEALVARLLAAVDTGYGVEAGSVETDGLLKNLLATELGEGSDSLIAKIEMPAKGGGMKLWT